MPIEQISNRITFYAFYVASKVAKTGLVVTVDVWEATQAGVYTEIVTGAAASELGDGVYYYALAAASVDAIGEYIAIFKTADATVDAKHVPAIWTVGRAGVEDLDALVSSRAVAGDAMTLANDAITAAVIATDAIDADALAASAIAEIQAGLSTLTALQVWTYATRTVTMSLGSFLSALKGNDISVTRGDTMTLSITRLGDLTGFTELWFTIKDDKDKTDPQSIIQVLESNPGVATDGLQAIAGAAAGVPGNGSITIGDLVRGDITIRVEAVETAKLLDCGNFYYDIQYATATDVFTIRTGRATVIGDVTRSI